MKYAVLTLALLVPATANAARMQAHYRSGGEPGYGPGHYQNSRYIVTNGSFFTIDDDALGLGVYDISVITGANIGIAGDTGSTNWFDTDSGTVIEATGQVSLRYPFRQVPITTPDPYRDVHLIEGASITLIRGDASMTWTPAGYWVYRSDGREFAGHTGGHISSPLGFVRVVPEPSTIGLLLVGLVSLRNRRVNRIEPRS